jgi:hypothetical protein
MRLKKAVKLVASLETQEAARLIGGQYPGTVTLDCLCFERDSCRVQACSRRPLWRVATSLELPRAGCLLAGCEVACWSIRTDTIKDVVGGIAAKLFSKLISWNRTNLSLARRIEMLVSWMEPGHVSSVPIRLKS